MKPRNEEQKLAEAQGQAKKPRFKIEKLEERIAPKCATNPHGKDVGCGKPDPPCRPSRPSCA